ncbi:MAG TPA: 4-hydroxy-3-methylbut-2-enyl diphosphate reductase [Gammaproteobacteria bacterium]|nr:4-hydroxy-3-methylbut-2-enyl diphosphate reductase [Gammaproteobacteria bacterium]|tara:strand:+ start:833 stop:1765 length:933 start_codon:yes stop_codon:yes gene_type:complete
MQIELANPRGFCAGVERAIQTVEEALTRYGIPIYVRHAVVHNRSVVADLSERGVIFVEDLDEVPDKATVILSAHGVSRAVIKESSRRRLNVYDATCPLVTKVHAEVRRFRSEGKEVVMIGHAGHPEVEGTLGQCDSGIYLVEDLNGVNELQVKNPASLAYVTQTTLSVDDTTRIVTALRMRFPAIDGPRKGDICYATQNRQDAIRSIAQRADVVLVLGSPTSSNSNRLREVAAESGADAHLIDDVSEIQPEWLEGCELVGVTAGASAPESLVVDVIDQLVVLGGELVTAIAREDEGVTFSVPVPRGNRQL